MPKRKARHHPFLTTQPCQDDLLLPRLKLPTYGQVLRSFIFKIEEDQNSVGAKVKIQAANYVKDQVVEVYERANIQTISQRKIAQKIKDFYDKDYRGLQKMPANRRDETASQRKISTFKSQLEKTMPFWSSEQNLNDEDHAFLESMKTDRKACMGARDRISQQRSKRKEKRMEEQEQRVQREEIRKRSLDQTAQEESQSSVTEGEDSDADFEVTKSRSHNRVQKLGTSIFIPHDVLKSPALVSAQTRNNITPASMSSLMKTLVTTCGGDSEKVSLSYSSAYR